MPIHSDDEIYKLVSTSSNADVQESDESDDDDTASDTCKVSHSDAARVFEWCLSWLEQQPEANLHNTTTLRELHILASKKRMGSLKQTKMEDFFQQ